MVLDSTWDVQTAIFSKLTADVAVTGLLAEAAQGVKDYVPPNSPFPYVVISEARSKPLEGNANEVLITLHCYSRASGMNEVRQIISAINTSLHNQNFLVPNNHLVLCLQNYAETKLEADGKTRHGIMQFQVITESEE